MGSNTHYECLWMNLYVRVYIYIDHQWKILEVLLKQDNVESEVSKLSL